MNNIHLMPYLYIFAIALIISLLTTPLAIKLGPMLGMVDLPDPRKVHKKIMPRSGGLSVFFTFFFTYLILELAINPFTDPIMVHLLLCCFAIFFLGFMDDRHNLSAKLKFGIQLIIAIYFSVYVSAIETLPIPFLDTPLDLGVLSIPFTVIWLVGITNAFNLIDGLDGLSGGIAAISSITFFLVSLTLGNSLVAYLSLIIAGTLLGFLFFNSHPAKLFLGDSGSLFIGFTMAALSVLGMKQVAVVSMITPILIFFVPISDTFYAIVRRALKGQPIFSPDKYHFHHCLLSFGFNQRQTVWIIYGFCITLSIGAYYSTKIVLEASLILLFVYLTFFQFIASKIGMFPSVKRRK